MGIISKAVKAVQDEKRLRWQIGHADAYTRSVAHRVDKGAFVEAGVVYVTNEDASCLVRQELGL